MSQPQHASRVKTASQNLRLGIPIIVLVLGATAIPVELRPLDQATISWDLNLVDMLLNLLLYLPLGLTLKKVGFRATFAIALCVSVFAESCQLFAMHRFPSPIDVALNVAGAITGLSIGRRWGIDMAVIRISTWVAYMAIASILGILGLEARSYFRLLTVNCRGTTAAGTLEGHWTFDGILGGRVLDSSGNELSGELVGGATLSDGIHGKALKLESASDYVDLGSPVNLRLTGSMTISAWIKATSFPDDDAAVVSCSFPGYQLDTTLDTGQRTAGFKLCDPEGNEMIRYGASALLPNTWYHIAGVYDAKTRAIDIYINGCLDNGVLAGSVAAAQYASIEPVYVGRRSNLRGYEFAGLIDDVRIESRALTGVDLRAAMNEFVAVRHSVGPLEPAPVRFCLESRVAEESTSSRHATHPRDENLTGLLVALGALSAMASAGLWPGRRFLVSTVGVTIGLLLYPIAVVGLPITVIHMVPILTALGGFSITMSLEKTECVG